MLLSEKMCQGENFTQQKTGLSFQTAARVFILINMLSFRPVDHYATKQKEMCHSREKSYLAKNRTRFRKNCQSFCSDELMVFEISLSKKHVSFMRKVLLCRKHEQVSEELLEHKKSVCALCCSAKKIHHLCSIQQPYCIIQQYKCVHSCGNAVK